jgi:hypothetical protein
VRALRREDVPVALCESGTTMTLDDEFRFYTTDELGKDGYPREWHETIKHQVREDAGHRCVRCGHPYRQGEHGNGEWSPCDAQCQHGVPLRVRQFKRDPWRILETQSGTTPGDSLLVRSAGQRVAGGELVEAQWRILTTHHLGGPEKKGDCRWHQLVAVCQRCHLTIQSKVNMEQAWPLEHSDWFKVYAAGHYAAKYEGREITRDEAEADLDRLLALERLA